MNRISIGYKEQSAQLPEIKQLNTDFAEIYSTVVQNVLKRADSAFQNFFRRVKKNETPGYPRFKSTSRYNSFTYVQSGFRLDGDKLTLSKIGSCRLRLSRPLPNGKIKTVQLIRKTDGWFAVFTVDTEFEPLPACDLQIGWDAGITKLFHSSLDDRIPNEKFYEAEQPRLRRAERRVARRKKYSKRWKKAKRLVAKIHQRIANRRLDAIHKLSTKIVAKYGHIAIEDLNVKGLARGILSKQVHDASWSMLFDFLSYKAERAGRNLVKVNPNGTSQTCICGNNVPKTLKDRTHNCSKCGLIADRDFVSAMIIEQRAFGTDYELLKIRAGTAPSVQNVTH